jgi:hypothetical protein
MSLQNKYFNNVELEKRHRENTFEVRLPDY